MVGFTNGSKAKKLLFSGLLLVLSINFISRSISVLQGGERVLDTKDNLRKAEARLEELKLELSYKKSDDFVEMEARNKLNMKRPNEDIYVKPRVIGDDLLGASSSSEEDLQEGGSVVNRYIFHPISNSISALFDKIKHILLLFQG